MDSIMMVTEAGAMNVKKKNVHKYGRCVWSKTSAHPFEKRERHNKESKTESTMATEEKEREKKNQKQ